MKNLLLGCYFIGVALLGLAGAAQAADGGTTYFTATIKTQSVSNTDQLGIIRITIGHRTQTCGLLGHITSEPNAYPIALTHTVVCPSGSFMTSDTGYPDAPAPETPCLIPVMEIISIVPGSGTGRYNGVTGIATANGTLDVCTGQNNFTISDGKLYGY